MLTSKIDLLKRLYRKMKDYLLDLKDIDFDFQRGTAGKCLGLENIKLDDGWPESEKGTDVDVKYIEERRRCEKISEERMSI